MHERCEPGKPLKGTSARDGTTLETPEPEPELPSEITVSELRVETKRDMHGIRFQLEATGKSTNSWGVRLRGLPVRYGMAWKRTAAGCQARVCFKHNYTRCVCVCGVCVDWKDCGERRGCGRPNRCRGRCRCRVQHLF